MKPLLEMSMGQGSRRQQQMVFAARAERIDTHATLQPDGVESIEYTAYRLVRDIGEDKRVTIDGHTQVLVPKDTVKNMLTQSPYWTTDTRGCNFLHVPDQSEYWICDSAGTYEVVYTVQMRSGDRVTLLYSFAITE